jgi:hypothetical protein
MLETTDKQTIDFSKTNTKIDADSVNFPAPIIFDREGKITATDNFGNTINTSLVIVGNCPSSAIPGTGGLVLSVSGTGTVSISTYGDGPQTSQTQRTTKINAGPDIDLPLLNGVSKVTDPTPGQTQLPTTINKPLPTMTKATKIPTVPHTLLNTREYYEKSAVNKCSGQSPLKVNPGRKSKN